MHRVYVMLMSVIFLLSCTAATVGVPSLIFPINGEEVNLPLTFIWTPVENAAGYRIEVDTTLEFSTPVIFVDVDDTAYTSTDIDYGIYYWRVAAYNESNCLGAFSYPHSFCVYGIPLEAPDVSYTVLAYGSTLRLIWTAITDAEGYYIYIDGVRADTISNPTMTLYDASVPAKLYEVTAFSGEFESEPSRVHCAPVITANLEVWDTDELIYPNAFGFNSTGVAVAYMLSDPDNWPFIDYFIYGGATTYFMSPHHGNYNDEVNAICNSGITNFDAINIAASPGGYYTVTEVVNGTVYSFWIDPTDNGWDNATDNFGKLKVEAIDGNKVTMRLAFQPVKGLRWCVTP